MGRLVLVEGLDLAGKSTLVKSLKKRLEALDWRVEVSSGDLCPDNPVAAVTRDMMRWDAGFSPAEGAPLFLASHLWDERNFKPPAAEKTVHLQDSCALRSLAFEKVLGEEFYVQKLLEVVRDLPNFDAAYVLTASMKTRIDRFTLREQNDLHDHFMLSDPVRFARVDSELLKFSVARFGAKLICTDELSVSAVLELVWADLTEKLIGSSRLPSAS